MSISFDENEQILFKGKATYNSKNGEIVVTSLRFAWVSSGSGDQEFHTAWANITNIKYSPADDPKERVMAMIQMVAGSSTEKPPVFHLTGPTKQGCRMELERLKTVVANVRKGKPPDHLESKGPKPANSAESTPAAQVREKKRSRTQMTVDKNSVEYGDSVALIEKRRELLVADKLLGKQYKELVEVSKLLTPEDFWDNYGSQHQQFLPESKRKGSSFETKGMLSVMLMDVEGTKNADGSRRIDLTKEKRDQIFQMYPAVRKAFEAEVPLNKTETDFWVAYFQSEFFARDKGGRATAGDDDAFGRTDDMFSRYEERLGDQENRDRRSVPSSSSGSAQSKVCKKNLTGLVGSDVDLTAVLGDFGPADASNLEAGSGLSKNKAIVDKYNKFSQMFMKGKVLTQGVEGDSRKARRATELSELNKEPEPAYLPLHLGHTGGVIEVIKEEEEGVSAFAKSAFAVKKSAVPAAPPQAAMTSDKLLSGLLSAFPSPQRAMSCFLADLTSLDVLSAVAQRAAVSAGESVGPKAVVGQQTYEAPPSSSDVAGLSGGIRAAGPRSIKPAPGPVLPAVLDLTGAPGTLIQGTGAGAGAGTESDPPGPTVPEGSEMGEAFRQEMTEQFTLVTEFSRHFYAMLNRDGAHAPLPNTTAAEKVIKIVGRLREYGENLSRKKKNLMAQDRDYSGSTAQKRTSSSVAVISEILKLIARVNMKWEAYQKSSSGINHQ